MNLLTVAVLVISLPLARAIVCMPDMCDGVKQEPLKCASGVIKGGGFCGCTDVCAKAAGEECGSMDHTTSFGRCGDGLTCVRSEMMIFGLGICKPAA